MLRALFASGAVALLVVDHYVQFADWIVIVSAASLLLLIAVGLTISIAASRRNLQAQATARLKEEENRHLADIVRSSEDAIFSVDLDGKVTAWNEGARNLYGYEATEAIDRRLTELTIPAERSKELGATFRRVISGGWEEFESERITKAGERIRISSRTFPIKDGEGNVVGMSISTHDAKTPARSEEEQDTALLWQSRIREALEHSSFVFWGQPVFDALTGEVDHTELLIRMELEGEIVGPDAFLPHAEASGLIDRIDAWAIREGVRIAARQPVAINLSGRSLSNKRIGLTISESLARSRTDPRNLRFEITETAAIENFEAARNLVIELNRIGCSVSLDDFGTGYGSFTYVRQLPAVDLKIDSSFVTDLDTEEASRRVVSSIVSISDTFGVKTVAEGIEDERTLARAKSMGITFLQGYYLGRPSPIEDS
jgi:PAS domain S-box-containing protein